MIHNNILEIKDNFDIFIFDAFGVFWNGSGFYKNALENMEKLLKEGKTVCVLSNTIESSAHAEKEYLKRGMQGKGINYNELITSGDAAKDALLNGNVIFPSNPNARKVYQLFVRNKDIFIDTDYVEVNTLEEAELVFISTPKLNEEEYNSLKDKHGQFMFECKAKEGKPRLWNATSGEVFSDKIQEILERGLPILNVNPDFTAESGINGEDRRIFAIRGGYIAEALKKMGAEVIELGKPYIEIYDYTLNLLKNKGTDISDKSRICMVGDTLRTDIKGANNAGIKSVLCIETGIMANEISKGKNLDKLIEENGVKVDYFIRGVGL